MAEFLAFLAKGNRSPERFAALLHEIRAHSSEAVISKTEQLLMNRLRQTPILCMNENPTNFLMWSYYANGHNGYAVVFDAQALPFASAARVTYSSQHPRILLCRRDMDGISRAVLATKAKEWRHEQEWRVIVPPSNAQMLGFTSFEPAPSGGYYGTVPREAIVGVVLGQQLYDGPSRADVLDELRQHFPVVGGKIAEIDRRRFRIVLKPAL